MVTRREPTDVTELGHDDRRVQDTDPVDTPHRGVGVSHRGVDPDPDGVQGPLNG